MSKFTETQVADATLVDGDGHVRFELVKRIVNVQPGQRPWETVRLKVNVSHYGHGMTVDLPQMAPDATRWLIEALQAALLHMPIDNRAKSEGFKGFIGNPITKPEEPSRQGAQQDSYEDDMTGPGPDKR